jgi:UDP-N-acetylglucosamine 2-epimerase (non-hydrolysing)
MKLTLVVGARPNFMKISPIIREIENINKIQKRIDYRLIHTGQHYDKMMSDDFFEQLQIPKPHLNLNCNGGSQSESTSCIMIEFEKELLLNKPDIVVVVGDVNSTMSCTIAAKKLMITVAHIESGIRSFDRTMPEEINRLITDSISDYFFTTSESANNNLLKENIDKNKIFFVGNTMIDCLINNINHIQKPKDIETSLLIEKSFFLMTLHRPGNVDSLSKLETLLTSIDNFVGDLPVIFPVHPRTKIKIEQLNFNFKNIILINPQKYLEFIYLIKNSIGVITDSGGISEETTFLNIPCLTLRDTTERPETVEFGTNVLIGDDLNKLDDNIKSILNNKWKISESPKLWDGLTSKRIIDHILKIHYSGN